MKKAMFIVFFDIKGVIMAVWALEGVTVIQKLSFNVSKSGKKQATVVGKWILLYRDNTAQTCNVKVLDIWSKNLYSEKPSSAISRAAKKERILFLLFQSFHM